MSEPLQEYQSLMRKKRLGQLSPCQVKRLIEVKCELQDTLCSAGSQQAIQELQKVNDNLAELEMRVDARIKQRMAAA